MGVFKWLRRERVSTNEENSVEVRNSQSEQIGTIRTEEYKRDLAEFQARRSLGSKELPDTPIRKKCSRTSIPSCTDCAGNVPEHDNTFNYEKKSAVKYKKKTHKRRSTSSREKQEPVPNIQFLFQNQVFMPGDIFPTASRSEPYKMQPQMYRMYNSPRIVQKQIDFNEDQIDSPPLFFKNNSLPVDVDHFLEGFKSDVEVNGGKRSCEEKVSSHESSEKINDDSKDERLWEVMSELKRFDQWAEDQLQATKSDDGKSDTSYGLPIVNFSDLDINVDRSKTWSQGRWGVVPVQIKKLPGVTIERVRRSLHTEINILRKCRHPNIILLMGLFNDLQNNVNIICESCIDTLFGIIHVQGRILSAQTSVQYSLDVANALVFLRMQGYVHTGLNSLCVMITSHDAAKLADLSPCVKIAKEEVRREHYNMYSPEPQYVNVEDTRIQPTTPDSEPLISQHPSEVYLTANSVAKPYKAYCESEHYRWHAPELFEPDENDMVHPCSKSDVYSLCLVLWECCNAAMPFKMFTYEKLRESYISWKTGLRLPTDGTYPGCLLALLQSGLKLSRGERIDLTDLQSTLLNVKRKLDDLEYVVIPARLTKKKSNFSSAGWDTTPTDDSACQSPTTRSEHNADIHKPTGSAESSERETSPIYETLHKDSYEETSVAERCYLSDDENKPISKCKPLPENDFPSPCSTPISKVRARIKDIGTPGSFHRSDSTEYCSILSPDRRHFDYNDDKNVDSTDKKTAKLSRSFTPKSYKPLHIKVPECNWDTVKSILKSQNSAERPTYTFDIQNYSLPSTPIARSNKLRKNAWLSGELSSLEKSKEKLKSNSKTINEGRKDGVSETPSRSMTNSIEEEEYFNDLVITEGESPLSMELGRDDVTGLKRVERPSDLSPEIENNHQERTNSWTFRTPLEKPSKSKVEETNKQIKKSVEESEKPVNKIVEEDALAKVNVKPLVAIHEKWIYEANRKVGRSMSLPEANKCHAPAVKPASHCVDTLQKSLPQLNVRRSVPKAFRTQPTSPGTGQHWEQFCQARDMIAKNVNFEARSPESERRQTLQKKDSEKGTFTESSTPTKIDRATDTNSIEDFIKDLIRKELQHLIHEIPVASSSLVKQDDLINKGVANIVESLKIGPGLDESMKKEQTKSYSRIKINGNNKPLLQITFGRCGENSLKVLDNCVNVTVCDNSEDVKEKANLSFEDTLTDDVHISSLKRCQTFSAIQEARSTEDLYIDDDLSTQMQENFGGKVKLIPLHGSLHEILCEREDDCCLVKVKQENGCDTIYFRCDNSDTESRDAIDGCEERQQDTVVFKRSISLVEERIQRIVPIKEKSIPVTHKIVKRDRIRTRPKSEVILQTLTRESRARSNSSPSLPIRNDDVEVNIENVMCYQDSSSDENVKGLVDYDEFEHLERKIEEEIALSSNLLTCLEKISEENLTSNEE